MPDWLPRQGKKREAKVDSEFVQKRLVFHLDAKSSLYCYARSPEESTCGVFHSAVVRQIYVTLDLSVWNNAASGCSQVCGHCIDEMKFVPGSAMVMDNSMLSPQFNLAVIYF